MTKASKVKIEKFYNSRSDRLVQYRSSATSDFWNAHWSKYHGNDIKSAIESYGNSKEILQIVKTYLRQSTGYILEGGCGIGGYVYCLRRHGFNAIGVDFALETIKAAKMAIGSLGLVGCEVGCLSFPDEFFDIYFSFGIIEHFFEGYDSILVEAHRVLGDKGVLILSFPQISYLRRMKILLGLYAQQSENIQGKNKNFYQFLFNPDEVRDRVSYFGFRLIKQYSKGGLKGFKDEINLLKPSLQKVYDYRGESIMIRGLRFLMNRYFAPFCGHMCQMIFRKE